MKEHENVEVGESRVGLGVFARCDIEPESLISEIDGETIAETGYESNYCMDLGDGRVLEPVAPFRFSLNHSCEPNAELIIWEDEPSDPPQISLHAVARIQTGDELTIDYGWEPGSEIPCSCGSPACRGWIVAKHATEALQKA